MVIKGLLKPGDHCIVSSMEHNAVMRPLLQLQGVCFDRIPCSREGLLDPGDVERLIRPNTRLLIMAHGSNVCGCVQDARRWGKSVPAGAFLFCWTPHRRPDTIP